MRCVCLNGNRALVRWVMISVICRIYYVLWDVQYVVRRVCRETSVLTVERNVDRSSRRLHSK